MNNPKSSDNPDVMLVTNEQELQHESMISREIGGERYIFLKEGMTFENDIWIDFLPNDDGK